MAPGGFFADGKVAVAWGWPLTYLSSWV